MVELESCQMELIHSLVFFLHFWFSNCVSCIMIFSKAYFNNVISYHYVLPFSRSGWTWSRKYEKHGLFVFRSQEFALAASLYEAHSRRSDQGASDPADRSPDQGLHLPDLSAEDDPSRMLHPLGRLDPHRLRHRLLWSSGFVRSSRGENFSITVFSHKTSLGGDFPVRASFVCPTNYSVIPCLQFLRCSLLIIVLGLHCVG